MSKFALFLIIGIAAAATAAGFLFGGPILGFALLAIAILSFVLWSRAQKEHDDGSVESLFAGDIPNSSDSESLRQQDLTVVLPSDPRIAVEVEHARDKQTFPATGIRIKNVGGSELHKLRLSSISIAGRTVNFEDRIRVISPSETSGVIYPIVPDTFPQQERNLLPAMLDDWNRQGGGSTQKLTFRAEATYEDYDGVRYTADWEYEFYPFKYRMKKLRESNACILSELMDYAEREKNFDLADRIKRISPVSWKHVNFYGKYTFREIGNIIDHAQMIDRLIALEIASYKKAV